MRGTGRIVCGLFALAVAGGVIVSVSAQELESDTLKVCEKQLKSKNPAESFAAAWRLAGHYRAKGELKSAEKILKNIASTREFERLPQAVAIEKLRCILEMAHVKALQEDVNGSLALLNWAEQRKDEFQRSVSLIKYAEILLDLGEFERGGEYQKSGAKLIVKNLGNNPDGAAIGQGDKGVDKSTAWRELKLKSDDLARELEFEMLKQKYGASYALYVKLRRCQYLLKKNFIPRYRKEAFSIADEIIATDPKSQFAESAKYLKGAILAARLTDESDKKQIKEVKDYLEKFVKENPEGLYRGEALVLLGKISLECEWDAKESEKYYKDALAYFQKARAKRDTLSLYASMSDELKKQTEPTVPLVGVDFWGSVKLTKVDPLKLYNTANTPPWYVQEQASECTRTLMWLSWHRRDRADAGKYMELFRKYDDYQREQTEAEAPSTILRYLAVMDYDDPTFSDKELEGLSAKARLQMAYLADFYLAEHAMPGVELIDRLLKKTNLTEQERGSFWLARGYCLNRANELKDNLELSHACYEEALKHLDPKSDMYALAMLEYILYTPDLNDGVEKRIKLYHEYMKRFPKSRYISLAHGKLILDYIIGGGNSKSASKYQNLPLARKMLDEYKRIYKEPYTSPEFIEKMLKKQLLEAELVKKYQKKGLTDWDEIDKAVDRELNSEEYKEDDEKENAEKK